MKHICKTCELYDPQNRVCTVTFIIQGEEYVLQTSPEDRCKLEECDVTNYIKESQIEV